MPELAKITWQEQRPFNLNNFYLNKFPYNLPYRLMNKAKHKIKSLIGKPYVQRSWELQFTGRDNERQLENYLFNNGLETLIQGQLIKRHYEGFINKNQLQNAHIINMLLVLSKFNEKGKYG